MPAQRLEAALVEGARPGFHGQIRIQFSLTPRALEGLHCATVRMQKVRVEDLGAGGQPTQKMIDIRLRDAAVAIARRVRLRLSAARVTAHYQDGRLQAFDIEECP